MILRNYQKLALERIKWSLDKQLKGNDLIVLPTGAGKSIVIAELANFINQDILILQPSKEILMQNKSKLEQYVDKNDIGVYSASLGEKVIKKYTFATIGSVYKIPEQFAHFKVVLIDECHLLNPKDTGSMFGKFLKGMGNPKVIGFTATPYRIFPSYFQENGALYQRNAIKILTRIKPKFWERILFNVNNVELVKGGYICPVKYIDKTVIEHDDIPLNKSESDFDLDKYEMLLNDKESRVAKTIDEVKNEYKAILVFCSSVKQAERLSQFFSDSACVSSNSTPDERENVISGFKDGRIKMVFNVGVLTTGFDFPELDCVILIRPTRSILLYYQMVGRVVRLAKNKTHGTCIDFSGTVKRVGEIESIVLEKNLFNLVELKTSTGQWHNVPLYSFKIKDLQPKLA